MGKEFKITTQSPDLSRLKIDWKESRPPSPWRFRKGVWMTMVTIIVLAAMIAYRFLASVGERVEVAMVSSIAPSQTATLLNASGYVVAQQRAAVASKGAGRLVELKVKEGDRVKKGEIVARLESADVAAALSRANANMNVAQSTYDQAKAELNEAAPGEV
jgi:HlyD family secretion protein